MPSLDARTTALILIDLQHGIVRLPLEPRSGADTAAAGRTLAARFRAAGATVVLVRVAFGADMALLPPGLADRPMSVPPGGLPADWSELVDGLRQDGDAVVTKRHWGAFTGTELDLLLRRRGIDTVVIGGIATTFGVESTARHAWEHGYHVVIAEDACTNLSAALHATSVEQVLPRIARVVRAGEIELGRG